MSQVRPNSESIEEMQKGRADKVRSRSFRPRWQRRHHIPELLQLQTTECGPVCLAMILQYYGCRVSISDVRNRCGVGRDGVTALMLVKAARTYGLRARAISTQDDLSAVQCPCILHWGFNHFIVLERWSSHEVKVVDPALGRRKMSKEEFDIGFTGVVLLLEPGVGFGQHQGTEAPHLSLRSYAAMALRGPGIILQVLFASLILQLIGLAMPLLTEILVGQIIPLSMKNLMPWLGIGIVTVVLSQLVIALLRSFLLVYLQAQIDSQMMLNFVEHFLSLPYAFFQQRSTGDLLARLNSNTTVRDSITTQFVSLILDGSFTFVYLLILLWKAPFFGLLSLILGLLQATLLLGSARPIHHLMQRELAAQGKAQSSVAETMAGIETLKAMGAEQRAFDHWSNLFFEQLNLSIRRGNLSSLVDGFMSTSRTLAPMLLLWVGAILVLNGSLSLGVMLALTSLASMFLTPLTSLASSGQRLQIVQAHLDRINDLMQAEAEQAHQDTQHAPCLSGQIDLVGIDFRYTPQGTPVLRNIHLSIKPGQKVAIVGQTGSGKSTLGKLLLGLYEPTGGEIYYDELPLSSLRYGELRSQFGVVLQDGFIFNHSVRRNIAFNTPHLSMERIIEVAKLAAIHDDILLMPMQYETLVAEGGTALSGGQRQRLALARALAASPAILLLDEATSHLDVVTEQIVDRNLDTLLCTRIVIAHRLSTIQNADLIVVLQHGEIVEKGTHEELLAYGKYYFQLVHNQLQENKQAIQ